MLPPVRRYPIKLLLFRVLKIGPFTSATTVTPKIMHTSLASLTLTPEKGELIGFTEQGTIHTASFPTVFLHKVESPVHTLPGLT